nr:MAG TPA: hypothetical protein [Caudoviricetes sp.]
MVKLKMVNFNLAVMVVYLDISLIYLETKELKI